jgi:ribonuclease P protein component
MRTRHEAHLPAKRPAPQAQARLSRPDVDPRRPRDPEAAARSGPEAALRLTALNVERRYRLSRSRDFDAVYRHGRSVSTRYLTLHWFPREDDPDGSPRLGLAVPRSVGTAVSRNRVKRQLRETWRALAPDVQPGHDYVLAARPGIAEPAETRGAGWLADQVREVLAKVAA